MNSLSISRVQVDVIGTKVDVLTWDDAVKRISDLAAVGTGKFVCICNSHSLVTARRDPELAHVFAAADLITPDGAPVAFRMRRAGYPSQERINGPDLMWKYCAYAEKIGQPIFLYGSTTETLGLLSKKLMAAFPLLLIGGSISPPFRPLTSIEERHIANAINESGAKVVWVGLGCPKQEKWMYEQLKSVNAVMLGVGAAFDYHAGNIVRAPHWMQDAGLEWLHRLVSEPRRLWKRYLTTNTLFIWYSFLQSAKILSKTS